MLHGDRVVPGTVLGQSSGRTTRGHRFLGKGAIEIARADDYEALLERDGKVIANFELRARKIRELLTAAAGGSSIAAEDALYDEVTALVEFPAVYEAHFEKAFLEVPQECLMLTMKQNQKYFPLVDGRGKLRNRFLIVSNMAIPHPHHIVHGNERVLRARLADAKFFYDQDRRVTARVARAGTGERRVPQQARQPARSRRPDSSASRRLLAAKLGEDEAAARRAARLCKADLLTGMVGEFPELQGIMGTYYARHDGEPEAVARRDRGALPPALRRRRAAGYAHRHVRRARRRARHARRHLWHRAPARPATRIRLGCGAPRSASSGMLVEQSLAARSRGAPSRSARPRYAGRRCRSRRQTCTTFVLERLRGLPSRCAAIRRTRSSRCSPCARCGWISCRDSLPRCARSRPARGREPRRGEQARGEHPAAGRRQGRAFQRRRREAV